MRGIGDIGVESQRQQRVVIEHPIGRSEDALAVLPWVPGDSDTRGNVIEIARNSLTDAQRILGILCKRIDRPECGREFHIVAHAVVQREVRLNAPGILYKRSRSGIGERVVRIAYSLNEIRRNAGAIGLYRT